jgi:hypothetical protein
MNHTTQHSAAWVTFTYISFAASAFMVGIGIWLLPLDLSIKAISRWASSCWCSPASP